MGDQPADYWVTSFQFTPNTYQTEYPAIDPTKPENSLAGKVVVVIGASKGLAAKGTVPSYAKAGPKGLVLVATNLERLQAVEQEVKKINSSIQTLAVAADVSDSKAVAALFEKIKQTFGHADILVNSATQVAAPGKLHEADLEEYWRNFEINTKSVVLTTHHFIRLLPSPDTKAAIITMSTNIAWAPIPDISGYITSKLASLQFTANIGAMYPNVTAVNVHPGLYETDNLQDAFRKFNLDDFSLIGGTLVWLTANPERSRFLSGRFISANWDVDGLVARKEEIQEKNLLVLDLKAQLGKEQFEQK